MSERESQVDYSQWRHVTSASQFETWKLCKRKWWWKSCIHMPKQAKESSDFGDTMHGVLERWLAADDQGRDREGLPVDLYPTGWDAKVSPVNAAQIRGLVTKAIDDGVIVRRPGRQVEAGFVREIVPGLAIQGYIDLSYPNELEVQDHKTTKDRRYAKTPEQLKRNPQMLVYAKVVMDAAGLGSDVKVKLRHNTFVRKPARVMQVGPVEVDGEAVLKFWDEELTPAAKEMLVLKERGHTEEQWRQVPGPIDEDEACRAYGGCEYLPICSGRQSPSDLRRALAGLSFTTTTPPGDSKVAPSVMDKLLAAGRGTTAVSTASAAPAPLATQPLAPASAAAAAVVPPPASKPAIAVPPWAQPTCNSCKGKGFNMKTGQACFPCDSIARAAGAGRDSSQFTISIVDGVVLWRNANGDVRGDMLLEGYTAPKLEVREPDPAARTIVQVSQPAGGVLGKLAAAAGTAPAVAPATVPDAAPAAAAAAPGDVTIVAPASIAGEPAKRGRGRPKKTVTLPPATLSPTIVVPNSGVPAAGTIDPPEPDMTANANLGTVPTRDESTLMQAQENALEAGAPSLVVEERKVRADGRTTGPGFILIIGGSLVGGIGMGQITTRDLSQIIRDRLAPEFEKATGRKWWTLPVYERRDALIQQAPQIAQGLVGFVTVDPNDGEAMPLARALYTLADGVFIANR